MLSGDELYQQLRGVADNFLTTSTNMKALTNKMKDGEGTLGKLINDEKLFASLQTTADDLGKMADYACSMCLMGVRGEMVCSLFCHVFNLKIIYEFILTYYITFIILFSHKCE